MDTFSKSDPMCVLFVGETVRGSIQYTELGRTEIIKDNLNPKWVKGFVLDFFFERQQYLRFCVYDIDRSSYSLDKHDFLGSFVRDSTHFPGPFFLLFVLSDIHVNMRVGADMGTGLCDG
jgi:hypothetical protein